MDTRIDICGYPQNTPFQNSAFRKVHLPSISPGISPGVLLQSSFSKYNHSSAQTEAAVGSSGPRVHEETHLNRAQFIKMSFESIDR